MSESSSGSSTVQHHTSIADPNGRRLVVAVDELGRVVEPFEPIDSDIAAVDLSDVEYIDWKQFEQIVRWVRASIGHCVIGPPWVHDMLLLHGLEGAVEWRNSQL